MREILITALKMFVVNATMMTVGFFALAAFFGRKNAGELFIEDLWAWALFAVVGTVAMTHAIIKHREKR